MGDGVRISSSFGKQRHTPRIYNEKQLKSGTREATATGRVTNCIARTTRPLSYY